MAGEPDVAASQAVETLEHQLAALALENAQLARETARLSGELQQRTDDLRQSREYQAAICEVLTAISRSTVDLAPVLQTLTDTALRLCEAEMGFICRREGEAIIVVTAAGATPEFAADAADYQRYQAARPFPIDRGSLAGRVVLAGHPVHIPDITVDPDYRLAGATQLGKIRTQVGVPLMREGALAGVLILSRQRVEPFSERQVGLLSTFADQAVIAMENARLLGELRESLDQQTATSEILQVINASPSDLAPVFEAMLERAVQLSGSAFGIMNVWKDGQYRAVALRGVPQGLLERWVSAPTPGPRNALMRIVAGEDIVHIEDLSAYESYHLGDERTRALVETGGACSLLAVALRKEGVLLGTLTAYRQEVRPFADKQIALLRSFAAQAVIAIENARLLEELGDRQAELRVTLDNTGDGVVMFDADFRLASWNRNFQAMLDIPDGFVAGRPSLDDYVGLLAERGELGDGDPAGIVASYRERASRQWSAERTRPDGRIIEVRNNPVPDGGAVLIYSDITERKRAEAQIAAARDAAEEALEQQTATAEILHAISQSPTDVQPVLDAVVKAAVRFCGAVDALIALREGEGAMFVAHEGPIVMAVGSLVLNRESAGGRAIVDGRTCHFPDIAALDPVEFAAAHAFARAHGFRAIVAAPLLRNNTAIGAVILRKAAAVPFTPRQIELLETFAAQAVIAIENVRLFNDLRESLEQQTATAEILQAISESPTNVQPVLDAVVKAALRFCGAPDALIVLREGDVAVYAAHEGPIEARRGPVRLSRQTAPGRAMSDGKVVQIADLQSADGDDFQEGRALGAAAGFRSALAAPLLRDDVAIGAISLRRPEAGVFTPRQVELLQSFAAQAVIAIENVRLFTELSESLEQQTATAEILQAIAQSPTDVQPVLEAVAKAAVRFCGAPDATILLRDGDALIPSAHQGPLTYEAGGRRVLDRSSAGGRATIDGRTIHLPDAEALDPVEFAITRRLAREHGFRAGLATPLKREDTAIGTIVLRKVEPGPFTPQQIQLLETFAAQAVIAIENVRLFTELRDSLERLKAAQANLIQSEKMASLGQLTAGIAHEIKNPLNFVNNFASLSVELLDELKEVAAPALAALDEDRRAEVDETMELLVGNLGKIAEHGKRADGIVKSMLSHSRGGSGDWAPSDINALVEEALNLAYHGARAQDNEFNVTLERDLEKSSRPIDLVPQDVTRVFLNLFGNGFYAVDKRRKAGKQAEPGFRPMLKVTTRDLGEVVEVRVRDNGTGIPPDVREKLFQPFFTTKPTGEGTGLGLSISYDIVTQQHGGTIEVESEPCSFTEFTVRLPRRRVNTSERA